MYYAKHQLAIIIGKAMKVKRDNFTRRNREKSNIAIVILETLKPESQNLLDQGLRKY